MTHRGIAIVGNQGVGKTTLAAHLERTFLLRRSHPKTMFGEMVAPIMLRMGVPRDEIHARVFGDRIGDPLPAPFAHKTTRHLLQAAGGGFLADFGVEGLAHSLTNPPHDGVVGLIESVRRPEEVAWLRREGWFLIRIERPSLGGPTLEHATECDLGDAPVNCTIVNDGSLVDLMNNTRHVVQHNLDISPSTGTRAVLVLNGRPGVGKDACTAALGAMCTALGIEFGFCSSIQPIKDMLHTAGVNTRRKSAEDRDLLAAVKSALQRHDRWCDRWVAGAYDAVVNASIDAGLAGRVAVPRALLVTHIREHDELGAFSAYMREYDRANRVRVSAAWVHRPDAAPTDARNAGDHATASQYPYDHIIGNDGTLADLPSKLAPLLRLALR